MEYASCAANGGELIHASVANHDSFKALITRCPCCKEPVIWRKCHTRSSSSGQSVNVAPAFVHRKSIDPLVIQTCELRVKSFTEQDIKKYASEARQQRWFILHQHFWNMLLTSKAFDESIIYEIAEQARKEAVPDKKFYRLLEVSHDDFVQQLRVLALRYKVLWSAHDQAYLQMQSQYNRENCIPKIVDETASSLENFKDITFHSQEAQDDYQKYFAGWDRSYHIATSKEVLDFLCSTQARELFREVLYFIMIQIIAEHSYLVDLENDPDMGWISVSLNLKNFAMHKLAEVLLMIDWRVEFIKAFELTG